MEIKDNPFGFKPVRYLDGTPYTGQRRAYWVDSSDSTALFIGDPVILDGTSNTAAVSAMGIGAFEAGELAGVTRATAGATNKVVGVVVGVAADSRDSVIYRAASTERLVWVADAPNLIFEAQADAAVATTLVGADTNILFTHAGDTFTGISGAEIDATAAADATYQCRIIGLSKRRDNAINTAGNIFDVIFNLHQYTTGVGQAGV